jgi:hypothetical protein
LVSSPPGCAGRGRETLAQITVLLTNGRNAPSRWDKSLQCEEFTSAQCFSFFIILRSNKLEVFLEAGIIGVALETLEDDAFSLFVIVQHHVHRGEERVLLSVNTRVESGCGRVWNVG